MHLSRVQIKNLRNFCALDVSLNSNAVIVGENRVGKSNFIFALRLVLDSSLPDSARQLKFTDIWDGCDPRTEPVVEVHLDFANFDADPNLTALLTDYRLAEEHNIARLSYVYRKKADVTGAPTSEADFEFKIYGAGNETRNVSPYVRRRICLELLHALRDADSELAVWRSSPLRPLLDDAISKVPKDQMEKLASAVTTATSGITALEPIEALEVKLKEKMARLAGPAQDVGAKLGITPSDPLRLFRSIRLLIDNGKRSVSDASLGSANLALLTLKLAEFEWLRQKNDHNFTILCIEEPEAHLHPHLQRSVFRKLFDETREQPISLFFTTHSPNVASVAPLSSIVVLKEEEQGTKAYSLANLDFSDREAEDLQRYLDVSRAELLFSRGVLFVEGDAEEALLPVFADSIGIDLDGLGIAICNVGGVNFAPYVRLASALALPFCVITDWDPMNGTPLGAARCIGLTDLIRNLKGETALTDAEKAKLTANPNTLRTTAATYGIFTNTTTLEIAAAETPELGPVLLDILDAEDFGAVRKARIKAWKDGTAPIDGEQLLAMVADIGKGRLAARLVAREVRLEPPTYIRSALERLT